MMSKKGVQKRKLALVTGASGGIGREIAEILLIKGYDLLLVARSLDKLEAIQEGFKKIAGERTVTPFRQTFELRSTARITRRIETRIWSARSSVVSGIMRISV